MISSKYSGVYFVKNNEVLSNVATLSTLRSFLGSGEQQSVFCMDGGTFSVVELGTIFFPVAFLTK